jgi:hypothetical protein
MDTNLNNLTKKELLNVISKMKKKDLIEIISLKVGGFETKYSIREPIQFNENKVKTTDNNVMADNNIYNKIYENNKKNNNKK